MLCTVATASRSLLTDPEVAPAASRVSSVVLDEAGTCPETKLPLLLCLPALKRIIAIGDQNQLQPFTHIDTNAGGVGGVGSPGGQVPRGVCRTFWTGANCRFGRACRFEHRRGPTSHGSPSSPRSPGPRTAGGASSGEPEGFFQRLAQALGAAGGSGATAVPFLRDQYRMHTRIVDFVSARFYGGALRTPPAVGAARLAVDHTGLYWLSYGAGSSFKEEPPRSSSKHNPTEAAAVLAAYRAAVDRKDLRGRSVHVC